MHNSVISTRNTCLQGSQPSSVDFACKTATIGAELQVSMGPRPHLSFCACKPALLASEILVSVGPSPHLFFFGMQNRDFRTRLTSLYWSQTPSVVLSTHYSVLSRRRKSLYWFQPSPVVLCMQNSDFRSRMTSLCGYKTPPVAFACKTATSRQE